MSGVLVGLERNDAITSCAQSDWGVTQWPISGTLCWSSFGACLQRTRPTGAMFCRRTTIDEERRNGAYCGQTHRVGRFWDVPDGAILGHEGQLRRLRQDRIRISRESQESLRKDFGFGLKGYPLATEHAVGQAVAEVAYPTGSVKKARELAIFVGLPLASSLYSRGNLGNGDKGHWEWLRAS